MTITTGADGSFNFKNVPAGSYTLTESQPAGLENGSVNPGNVIAFVLGAEAIPSHDFTETASSIAGSAYIDINKNGVNDAGDLPNPGVLIVVTGADGTWKIPDIRAGDYQITETQPPTMVDGAATVGNAGGTATSANVIVLSLRPGISATGYLFGDVRRNLPVTGADVRNVLGLAVLTLAAGVPLVMVGRRRNRVRLAK
jgi:large repetitive protein